MRGVHQPTRDTSSGRCRVDQSRPTGSAPRGEQPLDAGRWAFAELTEIYRIDADFKAKVESAVDAMIERAAGRSFRLTPFHMSSGHR